MGAPNTRTPKLVKEVIMKFKPHTDPNALTVGDFSTPLDDRQIVQTKTKQMLELTDVLNQTDLTNICGTIYTQKWNIPSISSWNFLLY